MEDKRQELIAEFLSTCADLFPYNSDSYNTDLMKAAENYVDEVLNPDSEFNRLCKDHDEMIKE